MKPITAKVAMLKIRHARGVIFSALDILDEIEERLSLGSGPEASRDEVGFDRSPQRDCMAARVAPALSLQPQN